jgi:hypothetical protein
MTLKSDLFIFLTSESSIAALVGSRIYRGIAPTSAVLPYMTLIRTGSEGVHHLAAPSDIADTDWQVDCWAENAVILEQLTESIRQAVDGRRGYLINTGVRAMRIENEIDGEELLRDSSEETVHRTTMLVRVWYAR